MGDEYKVCAKCNKLIDTTKYVMKDYQYKVRTRVGGNQRTLYCCSYNCWMSIRRETGIEQRENKWFSRW